MKKYINYVIINIGLHGIDDYNDKEILKMGEYKMNNIPKKLKLSLHAGSRLEERKEFNNLYLKKHISDSHCTWYNKNEFIRDSAYYRHCCYICRKSKDFSCMTDGRIEVIYNKNTNVVITILKVKEKFLPVTQYLIDYKVEKYNIVRRNELPKKPLTAKELLGS